MNTYILQIWKMNAEKQQSSDDPFLTISFEFESDATVDYDEKTQLQSIVESLVKKNQPVIDCAGWEAVVLDDAENEVLRLDDYYVGR